MATICFQLEHLCQYYIGDMVRSIQKTSLVPGSDDGLIYTTIGGSIGMMVPFLSKDVSGTKGRPRKWT